MRSVKVSVVLAMGLLVATTASAQTVSFTPVSGLTVPVNDSIAFDLDLLAGTFFDQTDVLIGLVDSGPTTGDILFSISGDWNTEFGSSPTFDPGNPSPFGQNVLLSGTKTGAIGPDLALGTLTVDTTNLALGSHTLIVQQDASFVINNGEGGAPTELTGAITFQVIPEPGTLALLAVGAALLRRRR